MAGFAKASAFGNGAIAFGAYTSAFGASARAMASGATAVGQGSQAKNAQSISMGYRSTAGSTGTLATALAGDVAVGAYASATDPNVDNFIDFTTGQPCTTPGCGPGMRRGPSTAIGQYANARDASTALGAYYRLDLRHRGRREDPRHRRVQHRDGHVGEGLRLYGHRRRPNSYISAKDDEGVKLNKFSTALGVIAEARGYASNALGSGTRALANYTTAVGNGSRAYARGCTALGKDSRCYGIKSDATGLYSQAFGYGAHSAGAYSTAGGDYSTATGWLAYSGGAYSTAEGVLASAQGFVSTAIGGYSTAIGDFSTAVGVTP